MRDRYQPGLRYPDSVGSFLRENWYIVTATAILAGSLGLGAMGVGAVRFLNSIGLQPDFNHGNNWASLEIETIGCSVLPNRGIEEREIVGVIQLNSLPWKPDINLIDARQTPIREQC